MKTKDFVAQVESGRRPIVVFHTEIENIDSADAGMMARVIGTGSIDKWDEDTSSIEVYVDFNEFEEHNRKIAKPIWSDVDGNFNLTWFDSGLYPDNGKETLNLMLTENSKDAQLSYFNVKEDNGIYNDYLEHEDKFNSYIEYLERRIMAADKIINLTDKWIEDFREE